MKINKKYWQFILWAFTTLFIFWIWAVGYNAYKLQELNNQIYKSNPETKTLNKTLWTNQLPFSKGLDTLQSLKQGDKEYLFFDKAGKKYTYRGSSYSYMNSCNTASWMIVLQFKNWECRLVSSDTMVNLQQAYEEILKKYIPASHRTSMNSWMKHQDQIGEVIVNYEWAKVVLSDIADYRLIKFDNDEKEYWLYNAFFVNPQETNKEYFLVKDKDWNYALFTLKDNAKDLIQLLTIEIAKAKQIINSYPTQIRKSKKDDKIARVYKYIVENFEYNYDMANHPTEIYDGMNGITTMQRKNWVCWGYSWAMYYLLDSMGIKSRKTTWLWCGADKCSNHDWLAIPYTKKDKNGKKKIVWKYFDPTFEQWALNNEELNFKKSNTLYWKLSKSVMWLNHFPSVYANNWNENLYKSKSEKLLSDYVKKNQVKLMNNLTKNVMYSYADHLFQLEYFKSKNQLKNYNICAKCNSN